MEFETETQELTTLAGGGSFAKFVHFTKVSASDEERIVEGYISSEALDDQGQVVTVAAMQKAIPDYMEYANLRAMHQPIVAGTVRILKYDQVADKFWVRAYVIDDASWKMVKEGGYKGFSIGGKINPGGIEMAKLADGTSYQKLTDIKVNEISLVDRPANPDAKITLWKGTGITNVNENETGVSQAAADTGAAAADTNVAAADTQTPATTVDAGAGQDIQKASGKATNADPDQIITQLQALRNKYEAEGDDDAASMLSAAIANVRDATLDNEADEENGELGGGETTDPGTGDDVDPGADGGAAVIEMAAQPADLAKAGAMLSTTNKAHLKAAHDHLAAMAGDDSLCQPSASADTSVGTSAGGAGSETAAEKASQAQDI